jgi:hypothetical protein
MSPRWGRLLAILAFPGIVVRQASTLLSCGVFGVPVLEVSWFQADWPAGPIRHSAPYRLPAAAGVVLAPFFLAVVLCLVLCLPGALPLLGLGVFDPIGCALLWPGLAIGACAFPPAASVEQAWQLLRQESARRSVATLLLWPAIAWLRVIHRMRPLRADLWSVVAAGLTLPLLLLQWAAA